MCVCVCVCVQVKFQRTNFWEDIDSDIYLYK